MAAAFAMRLHVALDHSTDALQGDGQDLLHWDGVLVQDFAFALDLLHGLFEYQRLLALLFPGLHILLCGPNVLPVYDRAIPAHSDRGWLQPVRNACLFVLICRRLGFCGQCWALTRCLDRSRGLLGLEVASSLPNWWLGGQYSGEKRVTDAQ